MKFLLKEFDKLFTTTKSVEELKEIILNIAIRGKLLSQDLNDEPASVLLGKIRTDKDQLIKDKKIKQEKPLSVITDEEIPYGLPQGWKWVRLGEVIELISGQHVLPDDYNIDGVGIPYLTGPSDFLSKGVLVSRWTPNPKVISINNDILITVKGSGVGKLMILNLNEAAISRQLMAIRNNYISNEFVYYILKSSSRKFLDSARGIAIPGIGRDDLLNLLIALPPLNEQMRIVNKLDQLMYMCSELKDVLTEKKLVLSDICSSALLEVNKAISNDELNKSFAFISSQFELIFDSKERISKLRELILSLAIQGKLVEKDQNDEPAGLLLDKIIAKKEQLVKEKKIKKEKTLPPIMEDEIPYENPQGWRWIRLGDLADFIDYRGNTPVKTESGIPLITAKNVKKGFISVEPREYIAELDYSKWMSRGIPDYGDVIFTTEAPLGNVAQLNHKGIFALAQRTITFKIYIGYSSAFLKYVLMSNSIRESINIKATGTTALGIKASKLKEIVLPLPPFNEQIRIITKIDQLMQLCDELEKKVELSNKDSEMLLQSVLQKVLKTQ
jgi:type I restriction enzyme S subunit